MEGFKKQSIDVKMWYIYTVGYYIVIKKEFPSGSAVKNLPAVQKMQVQSLDWEYPLEKEMANHSSILAWKISWTEEPGGLQFKGSQRVWHD